MLYGSECHYAQCGALDIQSSTRHAEDYKTSSHVPHCSSNTTSGGVCVRACMRACVCVCVHKQHLQVHYHNTVQLLCTRNEAWSIRSEM